MGKRNESCIESREYIDNIGILERQGEIEREGSGREMHIELHGEPSSQSKGSSARISRDSTQQV